MDELLCKKSQKTDSLRSLFLGCLRKKKLKKKPNHAGIFEVSGKNIPTLGCTVFNHIFPTQE